MTVTSEAPRGSFKAKLSGKEYILCLRFEEIESFEDKHRGIYDVWNGFMNEDGSVKPSTREIRDLIGLGLMGGGLSREKADEVIRGMEPSEIIPMYHSAMMSLGVALMPDWNPDGEESDGDESGDDEDDSSKKGSGAE